MTIEQIAQVAHEMNKAYCESIGDKSQPSWADAPEWQKSSAINGVKFHLENPDAGPDASHNSWLKQKEAEGWKWGPEKNPDTKEHPCYVPYNELPVEQQSKDFIFRQVVHSLKYLWPNWWHSGNVITCSLDEYVAENVNEIISEAKRLGKNGVDTNKISDGYHTFGELYSHRIALFISLCKHRNETTEKSDVWRSQRHSNGELAFGGGWFVLGIGKEPGKQITYHLPMTAWEQTFFAETLEQAPEFDGHTSNDVLLRLLEL